MDPLRRVDLNLLVALHALLSERSVTRAAERLGITQSAASNALARLRGCYGDPLLVRQGNEMQATPFAEALQPRVADAMRVVGRVFEAPAPFEPSEVEGTLRIATSDHVEQVVLEPLAARLADEAPGLSLHVEPFDELAGERVAQGRLALVVAPRARLPSTLRARRLLEEPFALVHRARHPNPMPSRGARRWFREARHVLVSPGGGREGIVDRVIAQKGERRDVVRVVPSFSQAILLVAESDLIATVPRSFARRYAERLDLVVARVPHALPRVRLDAAWAHRDQEDPLHRWFRERLWATSRSALARA